MQQVRFAQLKDATRAEWHFLREHEWAYHRGLPDRLLAELRGSPGVLALTFPVWLTVRWLGDPDHGAPGAVGGALPAEAHLSAAGGLVGLEDAVVDARGRADLR